MTIENPSGDKEALRQEMRKRLRGCAADGAQLLSALKQSLDGLEQSKRIAVFSALAGEPDLSPLQREMPRHHWLYPRVADQQLSFHRVDDPDSQLVAGAFGILEPAPHLPGVEIADIDIFICPGLAFDAGGGRLGRGRGFYDRMLAQAREDALKIGVGFACQLVEDACCEAHDIPMNAVLCRG